MRSNQPLHILLVDDDDVDAMGVARAFRKLSVGNMLQRAHDGMEALMMLRTPGKVPYPFLIMLDLNMPRMNGLEFLQHVRADPLLNQSVVFVLTTSSAEEDKIAAYQHQVAGYIVKNQQIDFFSQVVAMLKQYLELVAFPLSD